METTFDNCNNADLNNPVQNLLQNANTEFTSEKKTNEIFKSDNPFNDGLNNFMQISDTNNKVNTNLNCEEELEHRDLPKSENLFNFGDDEFEQKINEKRHFDGDLGPETSVDVPDDVMATESSEENLSKSSLSHSKDVLPLSDNMNPFDPKNSFTDFESNEFHVQQDDTKTCTSLSENLLDTPVDQASIDDAKNILPTDCIHSNGIHTEDSTPEDVMGHDHLPIYDDHGMGMSDDGKNHFIDNEFEDNREKDMFVSNAIEAFDQHFGDQIEFRDEQENNIKNEEFSLEDNKTFEDVCVEKDEKDIEEKNIRNESQDLFQTENVFELNASGLLMEDNEEEQMCKYRPEENENIFPNVDAQLEKNDFIDNIAIIEDQKEEQEIHLQNLVPDVDLFGEKDIEDSLAFKENEIKHSDVQFETFDETMEMNPENQFSSEDIDRKEYTEQETELNSLATVEENIEVQLGVEEVQEAIEELAIIKEVQEVESNIIDSNVQDATHYENIIIINHNMELDIKTENLPQEDPARESTAAESCEESEDEWNYMRLKGEEHKEVSQIIETEEQPTSPVDLENDKVIVENTEFIEQRYEETESKEAIIASAEEIKESLTLPSVEHSTDTLELSDTLLDNFDNDNEDMSSQLNPEAKEFIPINASPVHFELSNGIPPNKVALISKDDVVAQSPRKGLISMDDIQVPTEVEFGNEIAHCPSEMESHSPEFGHNDLYQEMNLKEAMHGSEKEEPALEESFGYDVPKNLDNVGMKESIYIEKTENLMNTVQPIPTNLDDDVDDIPQNNSIVANESITETMEKLNLSTEIDFDISEPAVFNGISETLKQVTKSEPTEDLTIELQSNVEQESPKELIIPSSEVIDLASEEIIPLPEVIAPSPDVVTPATDVIAPTPEVISPTPEVRMEFEPVQAAIIPEFKTVPEAVEPLAVKSNEPIEVTASPVVDQFAAAQSQLIESTIGQKKEEKKTTQKTVSKVEATKSSTKVLDAKKDIKPKTTTSTTTKKGTSNTSILSSETTKPRTSQVTAAAKPKTTSTNSTAAPRPRTVPSSAKPLVEKKTSISNTTAAARPKIDSKTPLSAAATRKLAPSTGPRPTKPDEQSKVGVKQTASKTGVGAKPSVSATRTSSWATSASKTRPATATANSIGTKPASQRVTLSATAKSASTTKTAAISPRSTLTSTMRKTEAIKSPIGTKKLSVTKTTPSTTPTAQTTSATKLKPSSTKTPTTPNSTLNAKKLPLTPSPRPIQKRTPIKKPTTTAVKKPTDDNNKTQDTTIDIKLNGTAIIETVNNKTELIE